MRLVVGQITDEVPSPVCGLGDGERLVGVNIVGALALGNVLCQPHGCGLDGHGGGVLADRDRVDDVSDNRVCADLGLQALNDKRLLAVGATGRAAVHTQHIITGSRPPRHGADVGVGGGIKGCVGFQIDRVIGGFLNHRADNGEDAHILGTFVHGGNAAVSAGAVANIAHDHGGANQQVLGLCLGQQDTGNARLRDGALILEVIAGAALQGAAVAFLGVFEPEHEDAEEDVADGDARVVGAALAPLRDLRIVAPRVIERSQTACGGGLAVCALAAHVFCMNHKGAGLVVHRADTLCNGNIARGLRGAVAHPPVDGIVGDGEPARFLGHANHAVGAATVKAAVYLGNTLDLDLAVCVDLVLNFHSPERKLLMQRVFALYRVGAGGGHADLGAVVAKLPLRGLGGAEIIEFGAESLIAVQQVEPAGQKLRFGVLAVVRTVPPRHKHIIHIFRGDARGVEGIIDGRAGGSGKLCSGQGVGRFQCRGNAAQRFIAGRMVNKGHVLPLLFIIVVEKCEFAVSVRAKRILCCARIARRLLGGLHRFFCILFGFGSGLPSSNTDRNNIHVLPSYMSYHLPCESHILTAFS